MTEIYSLTVLEPRNLKSTHWQGHAVCRAVTNGRACPTPLSYSLGLLAVLDIPWLVATSVHCPPICVSLSRFPSSKPASHWISLPIHDDLILTNHIQRPCFQIKSRSQKPEIRTSTYLLGERGDSALPKTALRSGKDDGRFFLWLSI